MSQRVSLDFLTIQFFDYPEVHGDRNATSKNLGTWAGPIMLLYCVCTGDKLIFFVSGTFYYINFFIYFYLKIKGEGLNDKKVYVLASLYIRKFKKKETSTSAPPPPPPPPLTKTNHVFEVNFKKSMGGLQKSCPMRRPTKRNWTYNFKKVDHVWGEGQRRVTEPTTSKKSIGKR